MRHDPFEFPRSFVILVTIDIIQHLVVRDSLFSIITMDTLTHELDSCWVIGNVVLEFFYELYNPDPVSMSIFLLVF